MDEVQRIADRLRREIPQAPRGTLRFWGEWFGRPHDNIHTLISCRAEKNLLQLEFDQGESLFVWSPDGLTISEQRFRISDAARVRWEWFYYGRPQTPENRYFQDFTKTAAGITASTNVDWYKATFHPTETEPAVEIL